MSADYPKIKRNIQRMIDQQAPEADIDAYVASEGVTAEELRAAPKPAIGAPAPEGFQQTTEAEQAEDLARTTAKNDRFGGNQTLQSIYDNFLEPWIPNSAPDFSERGIVQRAGDAVSFGASLPVRVMTQGNYGAGDVAKYLGAEDTGTVLEAGERDFLINNAKQVETVANAGDLAMGLPLPVPRQPGGPIIARRPRLPSIPNPLPASVKARLSGGPDGLADHTVIQAMTEAKMTPDDVLKQMAQGQAAAKFGKNSGALPENIADLIGPAGHRKLRAAAIAPGAGSHMIKSGLDVRQRGAASPYAKQKFSDVGSELKSMGQSQRVLDNLARALGVRSKGTAYQTEKHLNADLKRKAAPAYDAGWNNADDFDIRPAITKAMQDAADMEGPRGKQMLQAIRMFQFPLAPIGKQPRYRPLAKADELKRFDSSKRGLDDMIGAAKRSGHDDMARALTIFKHNLLDDIHGGNRSVPSRNVAYAEARQLYSGGASMRDAIELGRRALRDGAEVSVDEFRALNKGEQSMFRLGLFENAKHILGNQKDMADATQLFRKRNVAELLSEVFPAPKGKKTVTRPSAQFGEIVAREQRMNEGMNRSIYNSITAPATADLEEMTRWARVATKLRSQGVISVVADEVTETIMRTFGLSAEAAEKVARMLLSSDPKEIKAVMDRLKSRFGEATAQDAYMTVLSAARNRMRAQAIGGVASRGTAVAYPETENVRR